MTIFERGTNQPYISYIDIPAADMNAGDTITLHKSDFKLGELKTIQVNSSDNDFDNLFLYTYNSKEGSRDLISSFDNVVPNSSNEKRIQYISTNVIPINYWKFSYSTRSANATSYAIRSNSNMPSNITVKELTGYAITKSGNKFNFTHGNIFPDKKIARSAVQFSKNADCSKFSYSQHFDGSESIGTTIITPFDIPEEIINKYIGFKELNSLEWAGYSYSQTYTNIPENSSLDELKNTKLNYWNNDASEGKYSFETFSISLWGK